MKQCCYDSPIGKLFIKEDNGEITNLYFGWVDNFETQEQTESTVLKKAIEQLEEYFLGKRKEFDLPLNPQGTEFQQKAWTALTKIEFAKTKTYSQIAQEIGSPKGARAVGLANNKNPIPIIIPCHRVIGANGALTGFRGGLDAKQYLIEHEKKHALL